MLVIGLLRWQLVVVYTLILLITQPVWSQAVSPNDEQIQQFVQQAKNSGMTETQMETIAKTRGFSAADISRIRERINVVVPPVNKPAETNVVREQPPTPTPPQAVSTSESPVFGASLFANTKLSFEPNLRIPTPRNYIIGPDDELIIDIFGNAQQTYRPTVSPEGSIRIENLGPVYVNGLTIEQAEQRIIGRLRSLYQELNTTSSGIHAQLTLGSVRSINVTLLGQAVRPGTYTLSSLATVFNALYAAGGPSPEKGSFRSIQIYRANKLIRTLDLYDFLLRADQRNNIRLHDQDVIFIDHYTNRVELTGEVKQPGLYEIRPGETLKNALNFAGSFTDKAYTASIHLRRNTPIEHQFITIPTTDVATFIPKSGDRYVIGTILNRVENKVHISGAVFRPGEFALTNGLTVRELIKQAEGLREDAFLNRATLRRLHENLEPTLISIDLGKLLRGEIPDIQLLREDQLHIIVASELQQKRSVSIQGAINKGGTFDFIDSMTVANLIVLAEGFTDAAIGSRLEIARRVKSDTTDLASNQNIRLITVDIDQQLRLSPTDARQMLRPFDQVFVRASPRYEAQKGASISGEVPYPGAYAIRASTDRITDLIKRAGGLKSDAYLPAARFVRRGEVISVDLASIHANTNSLKNLLLEDGDVLTIPRQPDILSIKGEVLNPATVAYNPSKTLRRYVGDAGGFTTKAQKRNMYMIAANGEIKTTRSLLGIRLYPKPERGSTLVIPAKPTKEPSNVSSTERAAWLTVIVSGAAVMLTALRLFIN